MELYRSLADVPAEPGHAIGQLPVTTDMNGMDVNIAFHVLTGSKPGPTLTLLSGLHGNEWWHLGFFREIVETFDPSMVAGRVIVIPMANTVAFGTLSRYVRDDSDNADANRSFPGPGRRFTWLAEQVATAVADHFLAASDALIDFHLGIWGSAMGSAFTGTDFTKPEVAKRSMDMVFAYGLPMVWATQLVQSWPGPRSSITYAAEVLGIPACGSFLGGAGFDHENEVEWHQGNLRGIRNVMRELGMMSGEQELPERYLVYETTHRVNPRVGGLLIPVNRVEVFAREVKANELLGRVISPLTFEVLEELRSPVDGYLACWARDYPLRPGDWAYGIIPADHPGTRWQNR
jgi:predicted deacylase